MSNQFKVGSVYRDRCGRVIKVVGPFRDQWRFDGEAWCTVYSAGQWCADGYRNLESGIDASGLLLDGLPRHLLPGELVQVNGEWVSPTPTLDKMEAEKEQFLPCGICGTSYGPDELCFCQNCGAVLVTQSDVDVAVAEGYLQPAEPTRPALDWNKPTPFDPFKGYVVKCDTGFQVEETEQHALQRCADFDGLVMKVR